MTNLFKVNGQELTPIEIYPAVSDTVNYLTFAFMFSYDWAGLTKSAIFTKGTDVFEVVLTDDQVLESDRVNLSAGTWSISVVGDLVVDAVVTRQITTTSYDYTVTQSGATSGGVFPPSVASQVYINTNQETPQRFVGGIPKLAVDREISDDNEIVDKKYVDDHTSPTPAHNDLGSLQGGTSGEYYHITQAQNAALHAHSNKTALDAVSGTNTGDQDVSGAISAHNTDAGAHAGLFGGVNAQIASINAGPKGVYATVSDLTTAIPAGNTNLYVVTADGKWYYWNGSAWTAGAVYQATALANESVTTVKSTVAGRYGILYNALEYPNFNTTSKTFTIPQYSRIMCGKSVYVNTGTFSSAKVIDLSSIANGYIAFNPKTAVWKAYAHDNTSMTEDEILIATYAGYGATVNMGSTYTVNGLTQLLNGSVTAAKIADAGVTSSKIGSAAVTSAKSTVAGRMALLMNSGGNSMQFNTTAKTLTILRYTTVICGISVFSPLISGSYTIDLSLNATGYVTFNTVTGVFTARANSTSLFTENEVVIASYSGYGASVNSQSRYTIDGVALGIVIPPHVQYVYPTMLIEPQYELIPAAEGVSGWQDFDVVNGEMWFFVGSTEEEHSLTNGYIHRVNIATNTLIASITHNFGHCNTVHYDQINDSLLIGNLPGNTAYPTAAYIFYNVTDWIGQESLDFNAVDKTIIDFADLTTLYGNQHTDACCAAWANSNAEKSNIIMLSFHFNSDFVKLILGVGTEHLTYGTYNAAGSGKYNGTYNILLHSTFSPDMGSNSEVIQGATWHKGKMLTANGHTNLMGAWWMFDISGGTYRELIKSDLYTATGAVDATYISEGICVYNGYVYHGLQGAQQLLARYQL